MIGLPSNTTIISDSHKKLKGNILTLIVAGIFCALVFAPIGILKFATNIPRILLNIKEEETGAHTSRRDVHKQGNGEKLSAYEQGRIYAKQEQYNQSPQFLKDAASWITKHEQLIVILALVGWLISTLLWGLETVLRGPLTVGYSGILLKISRRESVKGKDVFSHFSTFWKSFAVWFCQIFFSYYWLAIGCVVGVLVFFIGGLIIFVACDSHGGLLGGEAMLLVFCTLLSLIPFLFGWVMSTIKSLSCSATVFIYLDNPNIKAGDAVRISRELMQGHRSQLFVLKIFFALIGIATLLCCLLLPLLVFGLLCLVNQYFAFLFILTPVLVILYIVASIYIEFIYRVALANFYNFLINPGHGTDILNNTPPALPAAPKGAPKFVLG